MSFIFSYCPSSPISLPNSIQYAGSPLYLPSATVARCMPFLLFGYAQLFIYLYFVLVLILSRVSDTDEAFAAIGKSIELMIAKIISRIIGFFSFFIITSCFFATKKHRLNRCSSLSKKVRLMLGFLSYIW